METPAPAELSQRQKIFVLLGCMLGMFLAALDQNVVATAGPAISKSLSIEPGLYAWITTAYLLAGTVLIPVYGKLSDLYGRRLIIVIGIVVFLVASLLCGIAQNATQLILFRALQGAGSASLFSTAFAVIADLFEPAERGKYTGMFGGVFGVASLVGPLLGGFITDHAGWHWCFLINLPVGAIALFFIGRWMPPLVPPIRGERPKLDVAGAVLFGLGIVPLLVALSFGRSHLSAHDAGWLWSSWKSLTLFAVALFFIAAFVIYERNAKEPLIDLSLFNEKPFAIGIATMFVLGMAFLAPMIFLPLFMVTVVGVTATASGLTISPLVLGMVAGNVTSGQLAARLGTYKVLMLVALVLMMAGFAIMGFTLRTDSTQSEVTLKMILVGLGIGPTIPLYTLAVQNGVPVQRMGVATSMSALARQLGATIGVALIGTLFASTLSEGMERELKPAMEKMPPQLRAQLGAGSGVSVDAEGGTSGSTFDARAIEAKVNQRFDDAQSLVAKALAGDAMARAAVKASGLAPPELLAAMETPLEPAQQQALLEGLKPKLETARGQAVGAVRAVGDAMKRAFTDAVKVVYRVTLVLAVLAFLLTLILPQVPLRRAQGAPPPLAE